MSYARFGADSDVYVFCDIAGHLRCCGCALHAHPYGSFRAVTTEAMLTHLAEHTEAGDSVPDYCLQGLRDAAEENDRFCAMDGPDREALVESWQPPLVKDGDR